MGFSYFPSWSFSGLTSWLPAWTLRNPFSAVYDWWYETPQAGNCMLYYRSDSRPPDGPVGIFKNGLKSQSTSSPITYTRKRMLRTDSRIYLLNNEIAGEGGVTYGATAYDDETHSRRVHEREVRETCDYAGDMEGFYSVSVTRRFEAAPIFPLSDTDTTRYIYICCINNASAQDAARAKKGQISARKIEYDAGMNFFDTHARQLEDVRNSLEFLGRHRMPTDADRMRLGWTLFAEEYAVRQVPWYCILAAVECRLATKWEGEFTSEKLRKMPPLDFEVLGIHTNFGCSVPRDVLKTFEEELKKLGITRSGPGHPWEIVKGFRKAAHPVSQPGQENFAERR